MNELTWSDEQVQRAHAEVMSRFARNSVAKQFVPEQSVSWTETTTKSNRYDYVAGIVIDRETYDLHEPYAFVRLTRAQGDESDLNRAMTTLNRMASALARWHDVLVFAGDDRGKLPPNVCMPATPNAPTSLREAALEAERETGDKPIVVPQPQANENLVAAAYTAVLRLEERGYYSDYHFVLGEELWEALHRPTAGSLVLPRERIEPTLLGGGFFRTTTLPSDEALMVSLDGPTFDCVAAGAADGQPSFEWLRAESDERTGEELYVFRVRERFAPRVRENRAVVRFVLGGAAAARAKGKGT